MKIKISADVEIDQINLWLKQSKAIVCGNLKKNDKNLESVHTEFPYTVDMTIEELCNEATKSIEELYGEKS